MKKHNNIFGDKFLNLDVFGQVMGNSIPTTLNGLSVNGSNTIGDLPIGGGGGGVSYKVRVIYSDGTPDFYVIDDGNTTLTQVEGVSILDNHDSATIKYLIIHSRVRHLGNFCLNGYAGGGNGDARWQNLNATILFMDGLETVGITTMADYTSQSKVIRLPKTLKMLGNWMFSEYDVFNQPFTIPTSVNELREGCLNGWYTYQQDLTFESVTPPAIVEDCFKTWFNNFPAKIVTGDPTNTTSSHLLEWKNKFAGAYGSGNIASINGVAWGVIGIKVYVTYTDTTPAFSIADDGTTIITQADGILIKDNHDVSTIDTIYIGNGITEIGDNAFHGDAHPEWKTFNGNFILPNGITRIGGSSMVHWWGFNKQINLPSSLQRIEPYGMAYWKVYNHPLTIPASVTHIGDNSFQSFDAMTNDVTFESNTPPTLGGLLFGGWKTHHPAKIITGQGTGYDINAWKTALTPSYNGGDIESINGVAWDDIGKLVTLTFSDATTYIISSNDTEVTPQMIADACADVGKTKLDITFIEFTGSVTSLADYTFQDCTNIAGDIIIPDSVLTIGRRAFIEILNITSINLPKDIEIVNESTFATAGVSLYNMTNLVIPSKITDLYHASFYSWNNMVGTLEFQCPPPTFHRDSGDGNFKTFFGWGITTEANHKIEVVVPDPSISGNASLLEWKQVLSQGDGDSKPIGDFESINGVAWDDIGVLVKLTYTDDSVGNVEDTGTTITTVLVDAQLTTDGKTRNDIKKINILSNTVSIGDNTFSDIYNLVDGDLIIPNSVTSIGVKAFNYLLRQGSPRNINIVLSENVTTIKHECFGRIYNNNQTSLIIPKDVTEIEFAGFMHWKRMVGTLEFKSIQPPTFSNNGVYNTFLDWGVTVDANHKIEVIVPDPSVSGNASLLEWKTSLTPDPANPEAVGKFKSINGVAWDDIADSYFEGGTPTHQFTSSDWTNVSSTFSFDGDTAHGNTVGSRTVSNAVGKISKFITTNIFEDISGVFAGLLWDTTTNDVNNLIQLLEDSGNITIVNFVNGTSHSTIMGTVTDAHKLTTTIEFTNNGANYDGDVVIEVYNSSNNKIHTFTKNIPNILPLINMRLCMSNTREYDFVRIEGTGFPNPL